MLPINGVVHHRTQENAVVPGERQEQIVRADLVPFRWWIGNAVNEVKQAVQRVKQDSAKALDRGLYSLAVEYVATS